MSAPIPAAVLGATGYVGGELLRLIAGHPDFRLAAAVSDSRAGSPIAATFPHLACAYPETSFVAHTSGGGHWIASLHRGSRLALFSAAPHGASAALVSGALAAAAGRDIDIHVVDVSADFRFADRSAYEAVYGVAHGAPELLEHFFCGLPEHVEKSERHLHIGHPGCFATAVLLAAVPLLRSGLADAELFVSGITGSTGSGRQAQAGTHHPERHGNLYAYKPLEHRHAPEIVALAARATGVDAEVHFVPHSGPFARGIHVTLQARAARGTSIADLESAYAKAYGDAPFVEIADGMPRLKSVVASNRCRIGLALGGNALVVTSTIDNLVKGAAGGAVQWMNRLWDLPETAGLGAPAPAWT